MNDYDKYMKYKIKYLNLKSKLQFGGERMGMDESIDLLHFWGNQFAEHAFMLSLMITNDELKETAKKLQLKWKNYLKKTFEDRGIDKFKIVLDDNDFEQLDLDNFDIQEVKDMIVELHDFKASVKNKVDHGVWIGWVFPSFAKHILDELNHFSREFAGNKLDPDTRMNFWNVHNAEEAGLTAHLLDPDLKNDEDINKADNYYHQVMNMRVGTEDDQMIVMSIKFAKQLDEMVTQTAEKVHGHKIKSIIHPALIDHISREEKRCLYVLQQINNQK